MTEENRELKAIKRWPTEASRKWVRTFLNSAVNDDNIVAVIAVGSAVRPHVPSVDLDLIVLCRDPTRMRDKPPIEIDLRSYAVDRVDVLIESGNDLLGWAIMYGEVLLQKDDYWSLLVKSWQDQLPLPSIEVATRRASEAFDRVRNMLDIGDEEAAYEQAVSYVTHLARVELLRRGRYPTSRPELPSELRTIGCATLANYLEGLINHSVRGSRELTELIDNLSRSKAQDLTGQTDQAAAKAHLDLP